MIGCLSFSISAMENSTDQLLMPLTDKILNVIGENANIEINQNVRNFIDETAKAESGGEANPLTAVNPLTNAMGKFQFIESENNDSLTTGLNRLSATKEDGSYVYFDDELPSWIEETRVHKDVTKLDNDQQTALFLANLHQQVGTNDLFKKISEGDMQAKVDMYMQYHYKKEDDNVKDYAEKIFFGLD
mgnify:FL=1